MPLNLKTGDRFPDASLVDHTGATVSVADIVAERPAFLAFYRGHW